MFFFFFPSHHHHLHFINKNNDRRHPLSHLNEQESTSADESLFFWSREKKNRGLGSERNKEKVTKNRNDDVMWGETDPFSKKLLSHPSFSSEIFSSFLEGNALLDYRMNISHWNLVVLGVPLGFSPFLFSSLSRSLFSLSRSTPQESLLFELIWPFPTERLTHSRHVWILSYNLE